MTRKIIESHEIVKDILSGTTDVRLMEKYELSCSDLEHVFRRLLDIRAINHIDVMAWSIFGNKVISTNTMRLFPRQSLDFILPVFETEYPESEGRVHNVSRTGLCVRGMEAEVDETKTLAVSLDMAHQVVSQPFSAICRWIRMDAVYGICLSGFSIHEHSKDTWQKILNGITMIRYLAHRRARA